MINWQTGMNCLLSSPSENRGISWQIILLLQWGDDGRHDKKQHLDGFFLNTDIRFDCVALWFILKSYGVVANIYINKNRMANDSIVLDDCCIRKDTLLNK